METFSWILNPQCMCPLVRCWTRCQVPRVNNCWFTVTHQSTPLTPPSRELPRQQGLCYGMWEGLWEQMTKINYSNERDILGIDFNSSLVQTDLSCTGVTTHCDQHLRDTANIRSVKVMWQCWLPQKQQTPPTVTKETATTKIMSKALCAWIKHPQELHQQNLQFIHIKP